MNPRCATVTLGVVVVAVVIIGAMVQRQLGREGAWLVEKNRFENELALAQGRPVLTTKTIAGPAQVVEVNKAPSPEAIIEQLVAMKASADNARSTRRLVHAFESLIDAGPAAIPAIRAFLARNQDVEYEGMRTRRDGTITMEFAMPLSLRMGLLEATKRIGGPEAEKLLADTLRTSGRGIEVAYLARALEDMAPGKYRALALNSARELLTSPLTDPTDPLGKFDRSYLYGVFAFFNDNSLASLAQSQLVTAQGQLDAFSLRYLQQTMGSNSVPMMSQLYQDQRVQAGQKEQLVRVALAYAGASDQANQLLRQAINDPNMSADARRNLIEDLNEAGFADPHNPAASDIALIQARIALIERLAAGATDPVNIRAFQEAYKDLNNMLNRLLAGQPR
jgi:hypothetical protein